MIHFDAPADIKVDDFFDNYVPRQFQEIMAAAGSDVLKNKEFSLQFDIDQKKYCLRTKDGSSLVVVKGGIDNPMISVSVSEASWRDAVTGKIEGVLDRFIDPTQIADSARYERVKVTKGTLRIELSEPDATVEKLRATIVFNGAPKPAVTVKLLRTDWVALQNHEVTGQALFMNGKMKVTGDMGFLMALQAFV
jgi:putative sterol carrier protein